MTAQKEIPSSLPARPSLQRPHAHSLSASSFNTQHRVNRRKNSFGVGNSGINVNAVAAIAKEGSADALGISHTSLTSSRPQTSNDRLQGQYGLFNAINGSAVEDGPPLSGSLKVGGKPRVRRASESTQRSNKLERPKSSAGTIQCEQCLKTYKHKSCLNKHLWEHTPQWDITSKLLISKHQQVQLLEAASVLVSMNETDEASETTPSKGTVTEPQTARIQDNELSSDSPAASGSSDPVEEDDVASSRTSTPSQEEDSVASAKPLPSSHRYGNPRRQDSYSSAFSRSYQSTTSFGESSTPNENAHGFSYYNQWSTHSRPATAGTAYSDEQADLTAAAESLLSCSLGTPNHGPTRLGEKIPPVPPLPAKFASPAVGGVSGLHFYSPMLSHARESRHGPANDNADVDMDDIPLLGSLRSVTTTAGPLSGPRTDYEEEGVFGRMD